MNTPYVKEYDENGVVLNPIIGSYKTESANRQNRRSHLQKDRFYGESKNFHLTVVGRKRYTRKKQRVSNGNGGFKFIEHYLERIN